jgi:hypothetical protein
MNRGAKYLACTALLAIAACGGEDGKLEIRSMPTPLAQGAKPVSFRVAEGHQQFALGNIALALESYRKAWREDPRSIDALAGIAACYDRMGRFDLAGRSYEAALAIEPGNTTVLAMLAASLDQQGKKSEALAVRDEIRQRLVAARSAPASAETGIAAAEVEVALPVPDLAAAPPTIASAPLAIPARAIAPAAVVAAFAPDEPVEAPAALAAAPAKAAAKAVAAPPVEQLAMAAAAPPAKPAAKAAAVPPAKVMAMAAVAPPARSVTVDLPKPIPVAASAARPPEQPIPQPARPPAPAPIATDVAAVTLPARPSRPPVALPVAAGRAPKLERTSLGEVALVTASGPKWASLVVKQSQRSATVRFVPLRHANARFASVRLLNAARVQGLAATARSTLFNRGWRSIAIGDANATRARSLVLYPAHRRSTALSLARQFGFASAQRASGREITVLLGRDAAPLARRLPAA